MKGYIPRSPEALLRDLENWWLWMFSTRQPWPGPGFVTDSPASGLMLCPECGSESSGDLGWRGEERGANVWLAVPDDEGVFQGADRRDDVWCAHPVQIYLDLKAHPERSSEAAAHLRAGVLKWGDDDR